MIYEYAVDPILMTKKDTASILDNSIGPSQGRLISNFPNNWCDLAAGLIAKYAKNQTEKRERLIELRRFKEEGTIFDRQIETEYIKSEFDGGWLKNARNENKKKPFRAIYSDLDKSISEENILEKYVNRSSERWNIPDSQEVERKAKEIGAFIKPLLELSSEIWFIDHYFNPSEIRFRNILEEFLSIINNRKNKIPLKRVVYRTSNRLGDKTFKDEADKKLPKIIPNGITLQFQRAPEKSFHRRSVITNICTVCIDYGLDEYEEGLVDDDSWGKVRDRKEIEAKKTQIYNVGREKAKLVNFASEEIFHQVQGEK
jgi:hypothetical protein